MTDFGLTSYLAAERLRVEAALECVVSRLESETDAEVAAAAHVACADQFIEALPLGYDTPLGERGTKLSPETQVVLEKNLAIIDQAIAEVRGVLESDPEDRGNALMLQAMHQQKVELLRRVSRLSS